MGADRKHDYGPALARLRELEPEHGGREAARIAAKEFGISSWKTLRNRHLEEIRTARLQASVPVPPARPFRIRFSKDGPVKAIDPDSPEGKEAMQRAEEARKRREIERLKRSPQFREMKRRIEREFKEAEARHKAWLDFLRTVR